MCRKNSAYRRWQGTGALAVVPHTHPAHRESLLLSSGGSNILFNCSSRTGACWFGNNAKPRQDKPTSQRGFTCPERRYRTDCVAAPAFRYNSRTMIDVEKHVLTEGDAAAYWNLRFEALEQAPQSFAESAEEHRATPIELAAVRLLQAMSVAHDQIAFTHGAVAAG